MSVARSEGPASRDRRVVLESLRRATDFLAERGVENPRLDAEVLLADVLGLDRVGVYLSFDRPLGEDEVSRYRQTIGRRGRREPLQQIRGKQEFFSREFRVDGRVLIPRGETETVVEEAVSIARGMPAPRILDVGTGSGAIAVTLALELPRARLFAGDVSPEAVAVARGNAERLGAAVDFRCGDLLAPFAGESFDLIVSNPPYVPSAEIPKLAHEIRDFEPRVALDGGADGLDSYRRLAALAPGALRPGGFLVLEMGAGERPRVQRLFELGGFRATAVRKDLLGTERVITLSHG